MADAGQLYSLKWNNHTNNMLQVLFDHLRGEDMVDVTLSCEGQFLKAHKIVLSACSPYFQELFKLHTNQNPVIIMKGMKFADVRTLVDFMYRGEIRVMQNDLERLLATAETLQVKGLSNVRANEWTNLNQMGSPILEPQTRMDISEETEAAAQLSRKVKKRKLKPSLSETGKVVGSVIPQVSIEESENGSEASEVAAIRADSNDDLATTIKVEPPDIRDIDESPSSSHTWDSPGRLVIDMSECTAENEKSQYQDRPGTSSTSSFSSPVSSSDPKEANISNVTAMSTIGPSGQDVASGSQSSFGDFPAHNLPKEKIPRPPNAFMIFANEWRKKLAAANPSESNKDISVRLGAMWKGLNDIDKEFYYAAAKMADKEHKLKYPGYVYSPKEARLRKKMKQAAMLETKSQHLQRPPPVSVATLIPVVVPDSVKMPSNVDVANLLNVVIKEEDD